MKDIRVVENPISGKIMILSTGGNIMDAVDVAVTYLNDPAYNDRDILFGCDHGGTSVEFPAGGRKPCNRDDVWEIISNSRGNRAMEKARHLPGPA